MKKKSIYLLMMLAAMSLSACTNSSGGNGAIPADITYSNEKVVNPALISANSEEYIYGQTITRYAERSDSIYLSDSSIYSSAYRQYGLLITKNYAGYLGFYSLIHHDYILAPQFVENWLQYGIVGVSRIGFLLQIRYDDNYSLYDGFGNKLFEEYVSLYSYETTVVNEKVYLTLGINNYGYRYFEYDKDGTAKEVYYIPQEEVPVDAYDGPIFSELYTNGWVNLSYFGLPELDLALTGESYITVFENKMQLCSFYVDLQSNIPLSIIGDKMLFQKTAIMPAQDVTDYSYIQNGNKYDLEHTMVSLRTGEKKTMNYNVLFSGEFELLTAPSGTETYLLATYQKINANRMLGDRTTSVVDKNFVFHEDVSGAHLADFIKYKDEDGNDVFFNTTTKILYDSNLRIITYLGNMDPQFSERLNMFVGNRGGYYGIVDLKGVTRLEFRYSNIYMSSFYNGRGLATIGNNVYLVNLYSNSYNDEYVGVNLTYRGTNLYSYDSNDGLYRYYYAAKNGEILMTEIGYHSLSSNSYLTDNIVYQIITYDSNNSVQYLYVISYDDFTPHTIDSSIKGEEKTSEIYDGVSYDNAERLSLGYNTVHTTNANYFYVTYYAVAAGTYFLYYDSYLTLYSINPSSSSSGTRNGSRYVGFTLDDYESATIQFVKGTSWTSQLTDMYLERDYGQYANYVYDFSDGATNQFATSSFVGDSTNHFGLSFTAPRTAHYSIELLNTNKYITYVYRNGVDVTDGLDLAAYTTVNVVVYISEYIQGRISFRINISDISINPGSSEDVPYDLAYGYHDGTLSFTYSNLFPHGFLRFRPSRIGTYQFSISFNRTVSYQYRTYDENGNTYTSSSGSASTINLSNGIRFNEGEAQYVIFEIYLDSTVSTYVNNYTISASAGNAYENPQYIETKADNYLYTNGYFRYYSFDFDTSFDGYLNISTNGAEAYLISNTGISRLNNGDNSISISSNVESNPILMVTGGSNSYVYLNITEVLSSVSITTIEESDEYYTTVGQNYFRFTNTGNKTAFVTLSYADNYCNGVSAIISDGFLRQVTAQYFSTNTPYYVAPGKSLSIYISNSDYPSSTLSVNLSEMDPFTLDLIYGGYGWYNNGDYYESANTGYHSSSATMYIQINLTGTLTLEYYVSSESGCDVLTIQINNNVTLVNKSGTDMTNYASLQYQVTAGDYIIISYTKDGSVNNGSDCARIRNIQIN